MKIVISISEKDYELACKFPDEALIAVYAHAIKNGAPLPSEHGKLIDADELAKEIKNYIRDTSNLHYDELVEAEACNCAYYNCLDEIKDALPILEASKSGSENEEVQK